MQRMRGKKYLCLSRAEKGIYLIPGYCYLLEPQAHKGNFMHTLLASELQELICRKRQLGWCTQKQVKVSEDEISQGASTEHLMFPKCFSPLYNGLTK